MRKLGFKKIIVNLVKNHTKNTQRIIPKFFPYSNLVILDSAYFLCYNIHVATKNDLKIRFRQKIRYFQLGTDLL